MIAHSNLVFTSQTGRIKGDCPFLICDIKFDATVWNPRIGSRMSEFPEYFMSIQALIRTFEEGRIILSSPDHISLLVHRTFNVSIPRHHIPPKLWEFEYGPAENDPEFGQEVEEQEEGEGGEDKEEGEGNSKTEEASTGKWVHRSTGERLGGTDRKLEFTVIGSVLLFYLCVVSVLMIPSLV